MRLLPSGRSVCGVGGAYDSGGRKLRDRNMIGMAVKSLRPKGYDHVRSYLPQQAHDSGDSFTFLRLIQFTINVIQKSQIGGAERSAGVTQFTLANTSQGLLAWILARMAKPAPLAPCSHNKRSFYTLPGIFCQRPSKCQ